MKSDVNISLLREYIVLAQVLNFTKAAKMLGTTQTVLSKHLAQLEVTVGKRLILRSTSPVSPAELTDAGISFLNNAFQIVNNYDGAFEALTTPKKISVSLGGHYHHGTVALATQVIDARHRQGVDFALHLNKHRALSTPTMLEGDPSDILVVMADESLDLTSMESRPLFKDRLMACLPRTHPLAGDDPLFLDQLKDETFLVVQGYAQYDNWGPVREMCLRRSFMPKVRFLHLDTNDDFLCTATFDAIYFVPAYTQQFHVMLQEPAFCCRMIADPDCYFEYRAVRRRTCPPAVRDFYNDLLAVPLESISSPGDLTLFR
jgi:DNA-binding transcriptional LysR family regulator